MKIWSAYTDDSPRVRLPDTTVGQPWVPFRIGSICAPDHEHCNFFGALAPKLKARHVEKKLTNIMAYVSIKLINFHTLVK